MMARFTDALVEIESLLYRSTKGQKESAMNSLHKIKTRKEMLMHIRIGDYEVDPFILDLGSDVNIITSHT